jgi:hypothetical protein
MSNKHPGRCYRCGETVEPGAGVFENIRKGRLELLGLRGQVSGKWLLQHHACAAEHRGTNHSYANKERGQ